MLRDESNGRHLRFNALAYEFIGRLDGDLSVQEIWDRLAGTDPLLYRRGGLASPARAANHTAFTTTSHRDCRNNC